MSSFLTPESANAFSIQRITPLPDIVFAWIYISINMKEYKVIEGSQMHHNIKEKYDLQDEALSYGMHHM